MKATEQTLQQVDRALRKVIEKFPPTEEPTVLTDIHLRVSQESGELAAFDDDDHEITRSVIEQWIDYKDDDFLEGAANTLRTALGKHKKQVEAMGVLKPFSFVLEDDEREPIRELYLVDDDLVIISDDLMADLDKDLDSFLDKLLKE